MEEDPRSKSRSKRRLSLHVSTGMDSDSDTDSSVMPFKESSKTSVVSISQLVSGTEFIDLGQGTDVDQGYYRSKHVSTESKLFISNLKTKDDFQNFTGGINFKENALEMVHFTLYCMGFGVGLGNLWRFPYVAYRHHGGSFLVAYSVMVALVGIPLFFLELAIGQFSGEDPVGCWSFCPILCGIGISMAVMSFLVAIPYSMTIGLALHYFVSSFSLEMPWLTCQASWASTACRSHLDSAPSTTQNNSCDKKAGTCKLVEETSDKNVSNMLGADKIVSTEEYFYRAVIGNKYGHETITTLTNWKLVACYLGGWLFVALIFSGGLKFISKIMYVTAILPYMSLITVLIACINLPGAMDGVKQFFSPDMSLLLDRNLWLDATIQVFFSLTVTFGGLISLAGMSHFHSDCARNTFILTFINFTTSILAGLAVFSCAGVLVATEHVNSLDQIGNFGPELIFIVYPTAVNMLPVETVWGLLIFATLFIVGLNNQLILLTTVTTAMSKALPAHPKVQLLKLFLPGIVCVVCCLLGLPLLIEKNVRLYHVIDSYAASVNALIIGFGTCLAITWSYGAEKFMTNIETMIGLNNYFCLPWFLWRIWWIACWRAIIPITMMIFLVIDIIRPLNESQLLRYKWLIWALQAVALMIIIVYSVVWLARAKGRFTERLIEGFRALASFGPPLPSQRASVFAKSQTFASIVEAININLLPVTPTENQNPEVSSGSSDNVRIDRNDAEDHHRTP